MNNTKKYLLIGIGLVILTIFGSFLLPKDEVVIKEEKPETEYIFVHIEGEVNSPGLIKVKYGTRLYELIEKAGGETENADLSRVNLAMVLSDEQKVIIPAKVVILEGMAEENSFPVNINTASKERLMTLKGVGEGMAEKIVKYREENGYFNSIEELKNVSGIGESKYNAMKDDITI